MLLRSNRIILHSIYFNLPTDNFLLPEGNVFKDLKDKWQMVNILILTEDGTMDFQETCWKLCSLNNDMKTL